MYLFHRDLPEYIEYSPYVSQQMGQFLYASNIYVPEKYKSSEKIGPAIPQEEQKEKPALTQEKKTPSFKSSYFAEDSFDQAAERICSIHLPVYKPQPERVRVDKET